MEPDREDDAGGAPGGEPGVAPGWLSMSGPLIARDDELAALLALVRDPDARVVVVTGPSGVGKTRLALAALAALGSAPGEDRRHPVPVSLGAVREPGLLADALVEAVVGPGRSGEPADALWERFGGASVVLLLDDLPADAGGVDLVLRLLERYPAASVVVTGLRGAGVPGERVVRLEPLAVGAPAPSAGPPGGAHDRPTVPSPAEALFLERVGSRSLSGTPAPAGLPGVAELCRAVGGLPLAIELAAARAASIPPGTIAAQLKAGGGLTLLHQDGPAVPERHRSLGAALAWTTGLLDPDAASLLAAMSVLEGPATLEAVTDLARGGAHVLDLLGTLTDLHLVEVDAADPEEPLFLLLPPVRAFAAARLAESGEHAAVVSRHDAHVVARVASGRPLRSHEAGDVLAALDRARLAGSSDAALELALRAAVVAAGPGAERAVAARVEALLDLAADPEGAGTGSEDGEPVILDPVLRARALVWSATHGGAEREAYAAWTHHRVQHAITAARTAGDPTALLDALELTVRTVTVTLDKSLALAGIEEGLSLAERTGDPARLARFRMWTGMAMLSAGQQAPAEQLLRHAFTTGAAAGDRVATDYAALFLRGIAVDDSDDAATPLPDLTDLLESAWRHHDDFAAMLALVRLARRSLAAGDVATAARHTGRMLPIAAGRATVEPVVPATVLAAAVTVLVAAGAREEAARVQSALEPLGDVVRGSMSVDEHADYLAAVDGIGPTTGDASPGPLDVFGALRAAEVAVWRIASAASRAQGAGGATDGRARTVDPRTTGLVEGLTPREREVLAMLAEGAANREIATALRITSKTVMHHTVAIYRKLGVRGRTEAAARAIRDERADRLPGAPTGTAR